MFSADVSADEIREFLDALFEAGLLFREDDRVPPNPTKTSGEAYGDGEESARFEREMMDWAWSRGFLFSAHLELTYRCNESCIHCYNPGAALLPGERPQRQCHELSTAEWKRIMNQLAEIGVFRLSLSGGEPTLRKDFLELVAHARKLGFSVVIFTNGLTISSSVFESLVRLWPHSVEVSIYSANPELHDRITNVPKSFQRSVEFLRKMQAAGIRTTMKTPLMRLNVGGYANCRALAQSLGADLVMDVGISPNVDGRQSSVDLNPDFETLVALAKEVDAPTTSVNRNHVPQRRDVMAPVCGAGRNILSVNPEGAITPCTAMPFVVGSVRDDDLTEIWRTALVHREDPEGRVTARGTIMDIGRRRLGDWQAITLQDFEECGAQDKCGWCQEICPGDALVISGNPLAPVEYRCKAAVARMVAAKHSVDPIRASAGPETLGCKAN